MLVRLFHDFRMHFYYYCLVIIGYCFHYSLIFQGFSIAHSVFYWMFCFREKGPATIPVISGYLLYAEPVSSVKLQNLLDDFPFTLPFVDSSLLTLFFCMNIASTSHMRYSGLVTLVTVIWLCNSPL